MVEKQFVCLCNALGKKLASSYKDIGSWRLDYQRCYGGYTIVELMENGAENQPYGLSRFSTSEMYYMIIFALRSIALDRSEHDHVYWPTEKIINTPLTNR